MRESITSFAPYEHHIRFEFLRHFHVLLHILFWHRNHRCVDTKFCIETLNSFVAGGKCQNWREKKKTNKRKRHSRSHPHKNKSLSLSLPLVQKQKFESIKCSSSSAAVAVAVATAAVKKNYIKTKTEKDGKNTI